MRVARSHFIKVLHSLDVYLVKGFVSELHLPMPTFRLSEEERQDVIAYIVSLKAPP